VGIGVLAAGPAAVTGWAEWSQLEDRDKRVGVVHAVSNVAAVTLYAQSWNARRKGRHLRGMALSMAGGAALGLGGYLGGHLNEARKVASADPAFTDSTGGLHSVL
jgi:hypothetical protein